MADKKVVFVAFAIEDKSQRDFLKGQSLNTKCPFEYVDMSVKEPYDKDWKERVATRIRRSDGVLALISKNSLTSSGQKWEIQCAKDEKGVARFWTKLGRSLRRFVGLPIIEYKGQPYEAVRVDDLPSELSPSAVYVAGDKNLWAASMLCPCGCQDTIELNLLQQVSPRWRVKEHWDGSVTISPSVWRKLGCRSHFIMRRGRVMWC